MTITYLILMDINTIENLVDRKEANKELKLLRNHNKSIKKLEHINIKRPKDNSFRREEFLLILTYLSDSSETSFDDIVIGLKDIDYTFENKKSRYVRAFETLTETNIIIEQKDNYEKKIIRINPNYIAKLVFNELDSLKLKKFELNSNSLEKHFYDKLTPLVNSFETENIKREIALEKYEKLKTNNSKEDFEERQRVIIKRIRRIQKEMKKIKDSPFHSKYKLVEIRWGVYDFQKREYDIKIKELLIELVENENYLNFFMEIFSIYIKIVYEEYFNRPIRKDDNFKFQDLIKPFIISIGEAFHNYELGIVANFSKELKRLSIKYKVGFKNNLFLNIARDFFIFNKSNEEFFNINMLMDKNYLFKNRTYHMFQHISKRDL